MEKEKYDIIFIQTSDSYTGSAKVLADIIKTHYNEKYVYVLANHHNGGFLSEINNVKFINVNFPKIFGRKVPFLSVLLMRLSGLCKLLYYGKHFNTFYINTILPEYAAIAGRLLKKNIVYHIHEKFVARNFGVKLAEYIFLHTKSKRIYVSNYLKEQYSNEIGCEEHVIYNKLGQDFIDKVHVRPLEGRTRTQVLMICSLSWTKGVYVYKEVARLMNKYDFHLIISSDILSIKEYLGEDIPGNLHIYPTQKDIHQFLANTDLIVNLSDPSGWIETFGMTILEAMAYHIPALVPNVGGPTELVENGVNGYCIDTTNITEVCKYIEVIFNEDNYSKLVDGTKCKYDKFK